MLATASTLLFVFFSSHPTRDKVQLMSVNGRMNEKYERFAEVDGTNFPIPCRPTKLES